MNKARERFYLEQFLAYAKPFRSATVFESEKPDFVVESKGKPIGIEETQYHQGISRRGSRAKESEVAWTEILELVKDPLSNFTGLVFTKSEDVPKRAERPKLVAELVTLARVYQPVDSKKHVEIKAADLRHLRLARYVRKIVLIRTRAVRGLVWKRAESIAGSVGFSDTELSEILRSKQKRVSTYDRSRFDELWLIIVATGESTAATGAILESPVEALAERNQESLNQAGFDRIWYYSCLPEFCVRLFPQATAYVARAASTLVLAT